MANIVNIVTSGSQSNQVKTEQVSAGAGDQGKTLKIKAQAGSRYQLQDAQSAQLTGPQTLKLKRVGNDLEVTFENGQQADVIIENYFTEITSPNEGLMGQNSSGVMQSYAPAEGSGISSTLNVPANQVFNATLFGPAIQGTTAALLPLAGPSLLTLAGVTAGAAAVAAAANDGADPVTPTAPTGANKTIVGAEDTDYTIKLADFGFSDANNNTFTAVKITVLPSKGKLTLNDVEVTPNQVITAADITAGKLVFTPATNDNGKDYASLQFKVQDNGGSNNEATTASKLTFDISAVNDAPVVTIDPADLKATVTEAGSLDNGGEVAGTAIVSGTLSATDVDADDTHTWSIQGTPSTTYGTVAINPKTGEGTYTLDNTKAATQALKEGQSVTETYIARVTDDKGAYVDQTITITITGTNDVPVITNESTVAGAVTEAGSLDNGDDVAGTVSATGTLIATDVDADATLTWSIQGAPLC